MKGNPLQLRSLNRGWTDEGKLYRKMEAYVAAHEGTMFFARPIYLDGSLCSNTASLCRIEKSGGPPSPMCRMQRRDNKATDERTRCPCRPNWLEYPTTGLHGDTARQRKGKRLHLLSA